MKCTVKVHKSQLQKIYNVLKKFIKRFMKLKLIVSLVESGHNSSYLDTYSF